MINDPFGIHDKQNQASATSDNNLYGAPSVHNVFVPTPQPTPQLTPEPTLEPVSEPTLQSAPQPAPQPTMESVPQPTPAEPASQPVLQPAASSPTEATPSAPAFSSVPTFEPSTPFSTSEAYNASPVQQLHHASEAQASVTPETANLTMQSTLQPAVTSSGLSSASSTATDRFNSLAAQQPAVTSASNFGVIKGTEFAGNASKPKSNKLITYSIAGVVVVVLAVAGVFGTKWFLRAQAYSSAIAGIDSVKNVAEKQDVRLSEASINDNTTADFFIKTGGAPNKTLFKDAKTPEDGLAKYDAVMKQLSDRRNAFGDKDVAEKIDSTKETYEKFKKHADASSKFLKIVSKYSKGMKHEWGDSQEKDKKSTKQAIETVNNLNKEMSTFKSSDKDFDKAAKGLISDLHKIAVAMVKNSGADGNLSTAFKEGSAGISPSLYESLARLGDEIKQMNDYFEETVSLRNQFVDSLADLRNTLKSKK